MEDDENVAATGEREVRLFGEPLLLPDAAAEVYAKGPVGLSAVDDEGVAAEGLRLVLLLRGGSFGESNCEIEGLEVKGFTKAAFETFLLAGGEKEVWTGCGKLGGSET